MFSVLFFGLPIVGVLLFIVLCRRMIAATIPSPPVAQMMAVFAAYGTVLLFLVSELFGVWSGMHSLAAVGLVFVGAPWLLVQGILLVRAESRSRYHQATAALSFGFPLALLALFALA